MCWVSYLIEPSCIDEIRRVHVVCLQLESAVCMCVRLAVCSGGHTSL